MLRPQHACFLTFGGFFTVCDVVIADFWGSAAVAAVAAVAVVVAVASAAAVVVDSAAVAAVAVIVAVAAIVATSASALAAAALARLIFDIKALLLALFEADGVYLGRVVGGFERQREGCCCFRRAI